MRKLFKPTDLLLLTIGGFLDLIQEVKDPFHLFDNYYSNFLGSTSNKYTRSNFYQLVWRNLKTKNIEKVFENGKVVLRLTQQGNNKIKKNFPLLNLQNRKWDKKWRLVLYDIEEKQKTTRELIRRKLKELGFAQFQKSVWISPHDFIQDLQDLFESNKQNQNVIIIETDNFFVEDIRDLAYRLWHLENLEDDYYKLYYDLLREIENKKSLKKSSDRNKKLDALRTRVILLFLRDPYLTKELLPDDWIGDKVKKLVAQLQLFS